VRLHLHRPVNPPAAGAPAVVFVHGGGWETGNPAKYLPVAARWAALGWLTVCPGYRLVPAAQWPAPYDDVHDVLMWLRDNAADLGVDPQRVVVVGDSAGGQLSLLAGANPPDGVTVRAVVTLSPLTDPEAGNLPPEGTRLLQRLVGDDRTRWSEASPQRQVTSAMPPVLSFVGSLDTLTTPEMVGRYHRALDDAGVANWLVLLPGRYHAFEFAPSDAALWSATALEWITGILGAAS
jgi:acetyl esterase/lipase